MIKDVWVFFLKKSVPVPLAAPPSHSKALNLVRLLGPLPRKPNPRAGIIAMVLLW